jgi:hypothetical protein
MADDADRADVRIEAAITEGIKRACKPIPPGAPGVCDDCGEDSPRLVNDLCARCRDNADRAAKLGHRV